MALAWAVIGAGWLLIVVSAVVGWLLSRPGVAMVLAFMGSLFCSVGVGLSLATLVR